MWANLWTLKDQTSYRYSLYIQRGSKTWTQFRTYRRTKLGPSFLITLYKQKQPKLYANIEALPRSNTLPNDQYSIKHKPSILRHLWCQLLYVSTPMCHPQGVIIKKLHKPTCQSRFCFSLHAWLRWRYLVTDSKAQRWGRGIALHFLDLDTRREWMVNTTPRPLYPRERPGVQCTGGWVGPRAGLDVCKKNSLPTGFDPRTVQNLDWHVGLHTRRNMQELTQVIKTVHWVHMLGDTLTVRTIMELET
jgi:hypothetical protein